MDCFEPYDCKYYMKGVNTFLDNYANLSGGAIYWNDVQPISLKGSSYDF